MIIDIGNDWNEWIEGNRLDGLTPTHISKLCICVYVKDNIHTQH